MARALDLTVQTSTSDELCALLKTEHLAWSILEAMPATTIVVADRDLRIAAAAGQGLRDRGYEPAAVVGRRLDDVIPAEAFAFYEPFYAAALTGETVSCEAPTSDGAVVYATELRPMRARGGEVAGVLVISRDVTEAAHGRRQRAAADAAHAETTDMFEAAFFNAPFGVAVIGLDGRFLRVNTALCSMLGRAEAELVGRLTVECSHPDDLGATRAAYADLRVAREPVSLEKRYLRPDGSVLWASCRGIAIRDGDGAPRYVVSHVLDITAAKRAEHEHVEATARFETAFADAPIGMALVGLDGRFMRVNRMLSEITGYPEAQLIRTTFKAITHPDDLDNDKALVEQLLAGKIERYTVQKRYFTAQNHLIWAKLAGSLVRDAEGQPAHFIIQVEDVSERRRLEDALRSQADHDTLTGLWNRRRFEEELDRQVGRCRRYGERAGLLMLDLDGFKAVNDRLGHRAGDDLLERVAAALRGRLRRTDGVARLGGDEFGVLLENVTSDQAAWLAEEVRSAVAAAQLDEAGERVSVTVSVGVSFLDKRTSSWDDALARADVAMYDAKVARGGRAGTPGSRATVDPESRAVARDRAIRSSAGPPVRVLHCDDAEPYRRLITQMMAVHDDIEVTGTSASEAEAVAAATTQPPDVILLGASAEGGSDELAARLRACAPAARLIVLAELDRESVPATALEEGFLPKSVGFDELADAIRVAGRTGRPPARSHADPAAARAATDDGAMVR